MSKEKKASDVEENKDEWYYHHAKKRFEEENKLNNSTLTPNRTETENSHNAAPQVERVERGNETTSDQVKAKFVSLKFPKAPKVNSSSVDIEGPDFSKISRLSEKVNFVSLKFPKIPKVNSSSVDLKAPDFGKTSKSSNIIPLNFPSPPSIVVSEVDVNNRFTNRSTIATHIQIVPLQFPAKPLVETTSVDEEVYLGVKREEPPRLTPQSAPAASSSYEEQEEKSEKTQITNELYDFIERGVGAFTYIKATGSTVIVYDEKKVGIQSSLARLAAEIAKIKSTSERDYDPVLISNRNSLNSIKTDEAGVREGIYVFDAKLFNDKESDEIEKAFEEAAPSLMGYGFKVFVVPFSAYRKYVLHLTSHFLLIDEELSRENKKAIQYHLTKELLTALAYGASGLDADFIKGKSYDALRHIDNSFNLLYITAEKYLKKKYGPIYDAILSEESPEGIESSHHKGLKDVIVYHLLKNEGVNVEDIKVEQLSECGNTPDVQAIIDGKRVAIDAKTSFHKDPISEIKDAYRKYSQCKDEVWVVLRPLPALLYAKSISGLLTLEEYDKLQVLIPVRDKKDEKSVKLIPFKDFLKEVRNAYKQLTGAS
ncbi:MAG: hypothetical protein TQ35_0009330 [Candidatus Aramenus sulfurataquae]|jgi:hypothetical protein|uniref:Uncharacterized protein n=4 Tax=Candidatus Aramenus sulfurataquae TaxID=1326980 RepID=A0AAE3FMN4_9CREN|nr:hypothetical protein [Candidatus Aramenus sulfurataquae]